MAEYVKRWDVSEACYGIFEEVVREGKAMTAEEVRQTMLRFEKAIRQTAAADVVEVVRCKDCRFARFNSSSETHHCVRRGYFSEEVSENDFCSHGERSGE